MALGGGEAVGGLAGGVACGRRDGGGSVQEVGGWRRQVGAPAAPPASQTTHGALHRLVPSRAAAKHSRDVLATSPRADCAFLGPGSIGQTLIAVPSHMQNARVAKAASRRASASCSALSGGAAWALPRWLRLAWNIVKWG